MCGITGLLSLRQDLNAQELSTRIRAYTDAIAHRGPDSSGIWVDAEAGVALGHRRLAIIDLTAEGQQPMISASGRWVMVFNGEIYNFLALRRELEMAGVSFRGRSDTEVILAAIETWGLNRTCQRLAGMFAIALFDRKDREVHFLRDRLGKKPLYIGWAGRNLMFSSELKSFCLNPEFPRALNREALALYFRLGSIVPPHTIYKSVWQVPPGQRLSFSLKDMAPEANLAALMVPYWSLRDVAIDGQARQARSRFSETDTQRAFETLLEECVQDRMISDVPLGAFLSGGIDSSLIVALMQKQSGRPVKTFTIGFEEQAYNEAPAARAVAAHLGTDHHEQILTARSAQNVIAQLPALYSEPFSDASALPTYLVSRFAREHVTVALSGDGGDEMGAGYKRHRLLQRVWPLMHAIPSPVRQGMSSVLKKLPRSLQGAPFGGQPHVLLKAADLWAQPTLEAAHDSLLSGWVMDTPLRGPDLYADPQPFDLALASLGTVERSVLRDMQHYLPDTILTKVDRASMAVALEARAPLLDHRLCEWMWGLPLRYKIRAGEQKWILRQTLEKYVPRTLFDRPKQGFGVPIGAWIAGDLRPWAEELLSPQALAQGGVLEASKVKALWQEHVKGECNHELRLWPVLMWQAWQRRWAPSL